MRQIYVLGLRYSEAMDQVVLIKKERPDWQRGKLNGISGKVQKNENVKQAIVREFKEEANVNIPHWKLMAQMHFSDAEVWVYVSYGSLKGIKTVTDEEIHIIPVNLIERRPLNEIDKTVKFLIPMGLYYDGHPVNLYYN